MYTRKKYSYTFPQIVARITRHVLACVSMQLPTRELMFNCNMCEQITLVQPRFNTSSTKKDINPRRATRNLFSCAVAILFLMRKESCSSKELKAHIFLLNNANLMNSSADNPKWTWVTVWENVCVCVCVCDVSCAFRRENHESLTHE